jgi:hypothetical protein
MLIIFLLFIQIQGKCALWRVEDGVDKLTDSCDDWEMFDRCKRAQEYLDIFTAKNKYQKIDLVCPIRYIAYIVPGRRLYCQHRDALNMCIFVLKLNPTLNCKRSVPIAIDGYSVIDYVEDRSPTGIISDFNLSFSRTSISSILFPFLFIVCFLF